LKKNLGKLNRFLEFFVKMIKNLFYHSHPFFKGLASTRSPDTQLSNKLTLSPNHWTNQFKFSKNSFNQQKIKLFVAKASPTDQPSNLLFPPSARNWPPNNRVPLRKPPN
jgi:hypothetical protein